MSNLKFDKRVSTDLNNEKNEEPQEISYAQKRVLAKNKLISMYNLSEEDAEKVLLRLESNEVQPAQESTLSSPKPKEQIQVDDDSPYRLNENESEFAVDEEPEAVESDDYQEVYTITPDHAISSSQQEPVDDDSPYRLDENESEFAVDEEPEAVESDDYQEVYTITPDHAISFSQQEPVDYDEEEEDVEEIQEQPIKQESEPKNVDNILSDIIPDYNQHISVAVDNVDLTFEVDNEKIDTIKESFIRTLKRNKSKKLKIHALKDVTFKIYKGERVAIIGYNGAGKSTLLNVISGIFPPDKGVVRTRGKISPLLSLGAGFDHNYSGRKNIFLNGAVLGYDRKFLESKVDEIIEFSELGEFIDIPIKNYSSGMLAKLGFSIATAVEPDILIIDEILGVGDVNFSKKSRDKIHSLMDGGTTVILVSHSIPQVRELCDKAIWIDKGEVREIGEVNQVCDHYLKDAEKASNEQLANIQFR